MSDSVNHPAHYGGGDNPYEVIKVIEAWGLGFCLGNVVKYVARAGKKGSEIEDLEKSSWYLRRQIKTLARNLHGEDAGDEDDKELSASSWAGVQTALMIMDVVSGRDGVETWEDFYRVLRNLRNHHEQSLWEANQRLKEAQVKLEKAENRILLLKEATSARAKLEGQLLELREAICSREELEVSFPEFLERSGAIIDGESSPVGSHDWYVEVVTRLRGAIHNAR